MRATTIAFLTLSTLIPAQAVAGGFVENYAAWSKAPADVQAIYLQGVVDGWLQIDQKSDADNLKARRTGIRSCFEKHSFDTPVALELVNGHYKAHAVDWKYAPAVVLYFAVNGMCLPEINEERAKLGLPALVRIPAQISKDGP